MEKNEKTTDSSQSAHEEIVDVGTRDNSAELKPENTRENADDLVDFSEKWKELNDKYLRLYSEFDNYRKRSQKEKSELSKWASEDLMKAILPVMDDFERGMKSIHDAGDLQSLKEGVEIIYGKMRRILEQKGLSPMISAGEPFNPDFHEAITQVQVADELKGKVIDEVERGYLLGGKVIRYAKVVVGS